MKKYEILYDFDIVLIKADGSKKSEEDGFSREGGGGYMRTGNTQWRKVKGAQGHMWGLKTSQNTRLVRDLVW